MGKRNFTTVTYIGKPCMYCGVTERFSANGGCVNKCYLVNNRKYYHGVVKAGSVRVIAEDVWRKLSPDFRPDEVMVC